MRPVIEFIPFEAIHALELGSLPTARAVLGAVTPTPEHAAALEADGLAWSGLVDGRLVGAAGVVEMSPRRGFGWCLFGAIPWRTWPQITETTDHVLSVAHRFGLRRIETTVIEGFAAGHRWVRRLGFELETPAGMRHWAPDGGTHMLYARFG